jgi:two-component system response regulator RegA
MLTRPGVLILDDDRCFCTSMSALLRRSGWPLEIRDPDADLNDICAGPDAVIIEPCPQGVPNVARVAALVARWVHTRVVVVTAYPSLALGVTSTRAGAHECLCKPVQPEVVLTALEARTSMSRDGDLVLPLPLARMEHEYISQVLRATQGNISEAARYLGIYRSTLQRRLRKLPPSAGN